MEERVTESRTAHLRWRDLAAAIAAMPEERKDDAVEIMTPLVNRSGDVIELCAVIGIDTIEEYCACPDGSPGDRTRSAVDNGHHPEQFVLLADSNPYDEDGNFFFTMQPDGSLVGDVTGRPPREDN